MYWICKLDQVSIHATCTASGCAIHRAVSDCCLNGRQEPQGRTRKHDNCLLVSAIRVFKGQVLPSLTRTWFSRLASRQTMQWFSCFIFPTVTFMLSSTFTWCEYTQTIAGVMEWLDYQERFLTTGESKTTGASSVLRPCAKFWTTLMKIKQHLLLCTACHHVQSGGQSTDVEVVTGIKRINRLGSLETSDSARALKQSRQPCDCCLSCEVAERFIWFVY